MMRNSLSKVLVWVLLSHIHFYNTSASRELKQANKQSNQNQLDKEKDVWNNYARAHALSYWDKSLSNAIMPQRILSKISPLTTYDINKFNVSIKNNAFLSNKASALEFCSTAGIICSDLNSFYGLHPASLYDDLIVAGRYSYRYDGSIAFPAAVGTFSTANIPQNSKTSITSWFSELTLLSKLGTENAFQVQAKLFTTRTSSSLYRNFLPSELVQALGDTSETNLPNIMKQLHISTDSSMAQVMHATGSFCDHLDKTPAEDGIQRTCVKSIEELSDFLNSTLSGKVKPIKKTIFPVVDGEDDRLFRILKVKTEVDAASKCVTCHTLIFPYQIYLCHTFSNTQIYSVKMESNTQKGVHVTTLAICHTNTTNWRPDHPAFQALKSKPGDSIVPCHFLTSSGLAFAQDGK